MIGLLRPSRKLKRKRQGRQFRRPTRVFRIRAWHLLDEGPQVRTGPRARCTATRGWSSDLAVRAVESPRLGRDAKGPWNSRRAGYEPGERVLRIPQ